jgi:fructose-bisphosphate aldolase, class I
MTPAQATANLDAINRGGAQPWPLSFSFGRALLDPAPKAWGGRTDRVAAAQAALLTRARLNGAARAGRHTAAMEVVA